MDPGKRSVLLEWVNCLGLVPALESLQELSNGLLFQKILQLIHEDQSLIQDDTPRNRILAARKFLEGHCDRDLKSLINVQEIENGSEIEIGKMTVFLLSAVIQSESGNQFRDPLVNLNPCLQVEIMHMMEAVVFGGFPSNLIFEKVFQLKSVPQKESSRCEENTISRAKTQRIFTNTPTSPITQFLQSPQMTQRMALCEKEREVKKLRCKLETLEMLKNELEADLSEKENTLQEKDLVIDQLKKKVSSLHQQHLTLEIENDNENVKIQLEQEIDRLQRKLKNHKEVEETLNDLDAENSQLHQQIYKLEEQLQKAQKNLSECQDQCKELLTERSEMELTRNEKEKLIIELEEQFKDKEKNLLEMIEMYQGKLAVLEEKLNETDNSLIGEKMSDVCIEKQMQELEQDLKKMTLAKEIVEVKLEELTVIHSAEKNECEAKIKNLKMALERISSSNEDLKNELERNIESSSKILKESNEMIESLKKENAALAREMAEKDLSLADVLQINDKISLDLESSVKDFNNLNNEHRVLLEELKACEIQSKEKEIHLLDEIQKLTIAKSQVENNVTTLNSLINEINSNLDVEKKDKEQLEMQIQDMTMKHQEEIQKLHSNIEQLRNNIVSLSDQISNLTEEKEVLLSNLAEQNTEIQKLHSDTEQLRNNIVSLTDQISNLTEEKEVLLSNLAEQKTEIQKLHSDTEQLRNNIVSLTDQISNLTEEKEVLLSNLAEQNTEIQKLHSDTEQLRNNIVSLTDQISNLTEEKEVLLSNLAEQKTEIQKLHSNTDQLRNNIVSLTDQISNLTEEKEILLCNLAEQKTDISSLQENIRTQDNLFEDLNLRNQKLQDLIDGLEADKILLQDGLHSLKNENFNLHSKNNDLQQTLLEKEADLTQTIQEISTKNQLMINEVDHMKDTIGTLQMEKDNLIEEKSLLSQKINEHLETLKSQEKSILQFEIELEALTKEKSSLKSSEKQNQEEIEKLSCLSTNLQQENSKLEEILNNKMTEIENMMTDNFLLSQEINLRKNNVNDLERQNKDLKNDLLKLSSDIQEKNLLHEATNTAKINLENQLKFACDENSELKNKISESHQINKEQLNKLDDFSSAVSKLQEEKQALDNKLQLLKDDLDKALIQLKQAHEDNDSLQKSLQCSKDINNSLDEKNAALNKELQKKTDELNFQQNEKVRHENEMKEVMEKCDYTACEYSNLKVIEKEQTEKIHELSLTLENLEAERGELMTTLDDITEKLEESVLFAEDKCNVNDKLENEQTDLVCKLKQVYGKILHLEKYCDEILSEKEAFKEELLSTKEKHNDEKKELSEKCDLATEKVFHLLSELEENKNEQINLKKELDSKSAEIQSYLISIGKYNAEKIKFENMIVNCKEELEGTKSELTKVHLKAEDLTYKNSSMIEEIKELKNTRNALELELNGHSNEINKLRSVIASLTLELETRETEKKNELEQLELKIDENLSEINRLNSEVKNLKLELNTMENNEKCDLELLESTVDEHLKERNRLNSVIEDLKVELNTIENQGKSNEKQLESAIAEHLKEIDRLNSTAEASNLELERIKSENKSILVPLESRLNDHINEINRLRSLEEKLKLELETERSEKEVTFKQYEVKTNEHNLEIARLNSEIEKLQLSLETIKAEKENDLHQLDLEMKEQINETGRLNLLVKNLNLKLEAANLERKNTKEALDSELTQCINEVERLKSEVEKLNTDLEVAKDEKSFAIEQMKSKDNEIKVLLQDNIKVKEKYEEMENTYLAEKVQNVVFKLDNDEKMEFQKKIIEEKQKLETELKHMKNYHSKLCQELTDIFHLLQQLEKFQKEANSFESNSLEEKVCSTHPEGIALVNKTFTVIPPNISEKSKSSEESENDVNVTREFFSVGDDCISARNEKNESSHCELEITTLIEQMKSQVKKDKESIFYKFEILKNERKTLLDVNNSLKQKILNLEEIISKKSKELNSIKENHAFCSKHVEELTKYPEKKLEEYRNVVTKQIDTLEKKLSEKNNIIEKLQMEIAGLKEKISQSKDDSAESSKCEEIKILRYKYEKAKSIISDLQQQIEIDKKETSKKFSEQIEKYKQYSETKRKNLIECQQLLQEERKISSNLATQLKESEKKIQKLEELLELERKMVSSLKSHLEASEEHLYPKAVLGRPSITYSHPVLHNNFSDDRNENDLFKKPYKIKEAISAPHIPSDNFDDSLELSGASHTNHDSSFDNSQNEFQGRRRHLSSNDANRLSDNDFNVTQRPVLAGTGFRFNCYEEEETCVFSNSYLVDLKQGKCNTEDKMGRLSELQRRNTLCLPHLKTSYPVETQMCHTLTFSDDDLKVGSGLQGKKHKVDSSDNEVRKPLIPVQSSADSKVKVKTGTTYQKPGPPTPGKSTGSSKPPIRSTKTPSSLKRLLKSKLGTKQLEGVRKSMAFNIGFSPKPQKTKGRQPNTSQETDSKTSTIMLKVFRKQFSQKTELINEEF